MAQALDIRGQVFGSLTAVERVANNAHRQTMWRCECSCGAERIVAGAALRNGNSQTCGQVAYHPRGERPMTYSRAHKLIGRIKGPAFMFACEDCYEPAKEWSYDHTDPNPLVSVSGMEYSLDTERYHARCSSCHVKFDAARRASERLAA